MRKSSIDTDKIVISIDPTPKSRFNIQALRETEREYHQSQGALEVLRDNQGQRSMSIRSQRARGPYQRRVINNYKNRYQPTNKGIW